MAEADDGPGRAGRAGAAERAASRQRRWAEETTEKARAWFTPERTRHLLGDKRSLLPPVEAAPLLRALGLIQADGSMRPDSVRKYMQVSHMVGLLECGFEDLVARHPVVRVVDAGCGSAYLTLALAWCFEHRWRHPARLVGLDRNAKLIEKVRGLATLAGLESVRFEVAELSTPDALGRAFPESDGRVHALIALHACDTATDHALAHGVAAGAELLAVAPCCQAELARQWAGLEAPSGPLAPIFASPQLRREAGATFTNALRMLLLRGVGYTVTAAEFVPTEHTPKNTLIRAQRAAPDPSAVRVAVAEHAALKASLGGCGIRLEALLASAVVPD